MKVFLAATSLRTDYGGPAYSVSRLGVELAKRGIGVGLWTPDGSSLTSPLLNDSPVTRLSGSLREALKAFGRADLIHDNGLWLPHNHLVAVVAGELSTPRVVSVRGMLEPWALRHKGLKKKAAWTLYQRRDLSRATFHHAAAEPEASGIERFALGVPVRVIPNGIDIPDRSAIKATCPSSTGSVRTALFLGRLYPVKGLPMLIEAWARVRPGGWRLRIAGPDEAGHKRELVAAVEREGLGDIVTFTGRVEGEEKARQLRAADVLILPSLSESFGVVVAEALAYGIPVLTTTATPWKDLPAQGCGWSVEPNARAIESCLRKVTSLDKPALSRMGAAGREFATSRFSWERIAREFVELYSDAVARKG
ncbi:MAG: glycosyltransferase [Gemmatimonadaceae bacterium]